MATGDVACRVLTTRTIRVLAEPGGVVPVHDADLQAFPWTDWHGEPRVNLDARTAGTIVDDPAGTPVRACLSASLDEFEAAALERLADARLGWLGDDAVVIVKHFWRDQPPERVGRLRRTRVRRFGETALSDYAVAAADEAGEDPT